MNLLLGLVLHWVNLEIGETYQLTQSLQLSQIERSGSLLDLVKGQEFRLKEITTLASLPIKRYKFHYLDCPGPELKTKIKIVTKVGIQLEEKCELNIYVGLKDVMAESFFE